MYRKICVTNRALAERPFLEQLACVLATKPYAMILREKDLTEEGYEELAGKVKKLCENTDTRLILHSFPDAAMHLGGDGHSYAAASVYGDAGRTKAKISGSRCLRTFGGGCAPGRTMRGNLSDGRACVCDRL